MPKTRISTLIARVAATIWHSSRFAMRYALALYLVCLDTAHKGVTYADNGRAKTRKSTDDFAKMRESRICWPIRPMTATEKQQFSSIRLQASWSKSRPLLSPLEASVHGDCRDPRSVV